MFEPGLSIGQILSNREIVEKFKCGNMGGMRRSKATNTLVIISDYTKGIYHDKWIGGVLHYTGMGKSGDQDINWAQNATLAAYGRNNVDIHLFEVIDAGEYIYCGRIELVEKPYVDIQPGEDGNNRHVWIFPIRPTPDNDVKKPEMFVFANMDDYKARGKDVDAKYTKLISEKKAKGKYSKNTIVSVSVVRPAPPQVIIPSEILAKKIKHKVYGEGQITGIDGSFIIVEFPRTGEKRLSYEFCVQNKLIDFI